MFNTDDPQMLGITVQYVVVQVTGHPRLRLVHSSYMVSWISAIK